MSVDINLESSSAQALRAKRLKQIASLVLFAFAIVFPFYIVKQVWPIVLSLLFGMGMMGVCLLINRRGLTGLANVLLLYSLTVAISAMMWIGGGLHDVAMFTYPVILVMAGLLIQPRHFFALLISMLAFVLVLGLATDVYRIRVNADTSGWLDDVRDICLIMLAGACAVWFIVNDLQEALATLRSQLTQLGITQHHLTYLSQHDELTALPNRTTGRDRIDQAIGQASRNKQRVALLFVDLDNFKAINDLLGHDVGDEFLRQVSVRLAQAVRKSDIVSRHGGDEFVVGLTEIVDVQDVSTVATTIMGALAEPFTANGTELAVSCSIGIALYPDDGNDYESLLRLSDIAMYQAKDSGRNALCFFDAAMNVSLQQSLLLVSELRSALVRNEFVLHYQPVVNLNTGRLVGAEALVRWQHPDKGLVPPNMFIPAAEKSGLILGLGEWVLNEACRQMVQWQADGLGDFVMAVNLSPVQFRRGSIEAVVQNALQHSGLRPQHLELEITESTLIQDSEQFIRSLQQLKALGVKISIDDFGTGYSNLSYLQRFAVDKLKIDQSFVGRLQHGKQERAIVNAIIQMARSLNLSTTAEGIEEDAVRQTLIELGCELGQGYFFSRPVHADQFVRFLHNEPLIIQN